MKIYQAGPLFSEAEQQWHRQFGQDLQQAGFEVLWPFDLSTQEEIASWGTDAPRRIMEQDRLALESCDVVVALLDGAQVDDGTAWEIGYAFARGIPVIGVRTDFRQGGDTAHSCVNAMIEGSCVRIAASRDEAVAVLRELGTISVRHSRTAGKRPG